MMNIFCFPSEERKCSVFWVIFFLFPFLTHAQSIDSVNIVDHLVIGDAPFKSMEYILDEPVDVSVGNKGNMYIADQGTMTIKVFDKDGNYLRSIGQEGRGPGEFLSFKEVSINKENELIIADREQIRGTKLDAQGEVLSSFTTSEQTQAIAYFSQIEQLPNGNNLVLYKLGNPGNKNDNIFHIWDSQFTELLQEFGSFSEIDYQSDFARYYGLLGVGSFYVKNSDEIIFAPNIYQGGIFRFTKEEMEWSSSEKITGYNLPFSSTVSYATNMTKGELIKKGGMEVATPEGRFKGDIRIFSGGIFGLQNGHTAHFIFLKKQSGPDKGKWELGVEIFDNELSYQGFFSLRKFNGVNNRIEPVIKAKDQGDNFYMISREGSFVVRKFSLDIQYR